MDFDEKMTIAIVTEAARIEEFALKMGDEFERRNGEGTSVDVLFNAGGMIVASALSLVDEDEVCAARSSFSARMTDRPRPARSRAIPAPLIPPPTTRTSQETLAGDNSFFLRISSLMFVLPRKIRRCKPRGIPMTHSAFFIYS